MNNEKFDINCPHCGNELEVDLSLLGEQVSCPCCNKNFVVRIPQQKQTKDTAHEESKVKKDYPWGRAYITFARLLALLVLAVVLCIIVRSLCQPFLLRNEEIKHLQKSQVPLLVEKQKDFQEYFTKTIELIAAENRSDDTFKFPANIAEHPDFFSETLLSREDVEKSQKTLKLYDEKITQISSAMNDFFARQYNRILKMVNSGNAIKMSFGNTSEKKPKAPTSLVMTFDQWIHFYTDTEKNVSREINTIRSLLEVLELKKKENRLGYQYEIDAIRKGVNFIESRFMSKNEKFIIGSLHTSSQTSYKKTITSGRNQYQIEKRMLQQIIVLLTRLSSPENRNGYCWLISLKSQQLNDALAEHLNSINKINERFQNSLKTALIFSLCLILVGAFSAFLLMVLGDFLQAHFDSAVSLKGINSKMKNFLLLPLFFLLFLTGCENSPKAITAKEMERLQILAINSIFAEKISENPGASVYLVPGKELILISGGVKKIFWDKFITAATCHAVSHVTCTSSVSISSPKEYDNPPYSHKALLQINVKYMVKSTDTDKNPDGTPGTLIHFLPPTNLNSANFNKAQWIEKKLSEIPDSPINHAVVLHNVSKNKPFFFKENKNYTICYDSQKKVWEIKNTYGEISAPEPPVYSEIHLKQVMRRFNFIQFTTNVSGDIKDFWVHENEYDTADKLWNQGLICVDGVWKKREIVFNTRILSESLAEWKKKTNHTLDDLGQLLKAIKETPDAENLDLAIRVAENELLTVLMKVSKNPDEKDKKRLLELQKFIRTSPYITVVNKNIIEKACTDQINFVEETIQKKNLSHKKKETTLSLIISTINEYHSERYAQTLSNKLKKYFSSLDNKSLKEAFNHWLQVADIMRRPLASRSTLYQKKGKWGEYRLLTACADCRGTGIKNCGVCDNTGACRICGGSGRRTSEMRTGAKRHKVIVFSCPRECKSCYGQKAGCYICYKGYVIEKETLKRAFYTELDKLKKLVEKELLTLKTRQHQ